MQDGSINSASLAVRRIAIRMDHSPLNKLLSRTVVKTLLSSLTAILLATSALAGVDEEREAIRQQGQAFCEKYPNDIACRQHDPAPQPPPPPQYQPPQCTPCGHPIVTIPNPICPSCGTMRIL